MRVGDKRASIRAVLVFFVERRGEIGGGPYKGPSGFGNVTGLPRLQLY
jgi:hypothetical protein